MTLNRCIASMGLLMLLIVMKFSFGDPQSHYAIYNFQAFIKGQEKLAPPAAFDGTWRDWTGSGMLCSSAEYSDGKMNGKRRIYGAAGSVMHEMNYQNNVQHGLDIIFYDNGNVMQILNVDQGKAGKSIKFDFPGKSHLDALKNLKSEN